MATAEKKHSPELVNRILSFFRTQADNAPVDAHACLVDIKPDLAKLVAKEEAEAAIEKAEKAKIKLPEKAAEKMDAGRELVVGDVIESLKAQGILTGLKLDKGGMGIRYSGERPANDWPEGQTPVLKSLALEKIRVDKNIQQREGGLDDRVVANYAAVTDSLPPVRIFHSKKDGKDINILSRGFHRIAGRKLAGRDMIDCEIFEGDRNAAILDAVGDNAEHGFARSDRDVKKAIGTLLELPGWKRASTNMIAEKVKCSWATADKYRKAFERAAGAASEGTRTDKRGAQRKSTRTAPAADPKKADPTVGPPETKPDAAPAPVATGIKDGRGVDIFDENIAKAFSDQRLKLALKSVSECLDYIVGIEADGYSLTSLSVKAREETCNEMRHWLETLQLSVPFAICPEKPGKEFNAAARRGWMTKAEWTEYAKKADAAPKAATPPAAPPATQPAATATPAPAPAATSQAENKTPQANAAA